MKVNPRDISEGLSYENPLMGWISANRIKMGELDSPNILLELLRVTMNQEALA